MTKSGLTKAIERAVGGEAVAYDVGKLKTVQIGDFYCDVKRSPLEDDTYIITAPEGYVFTGFMSKTVMVKHINHHHQPEGHTLYGLSLTEVGTFEAA